MGARLPVLLEGQLTSLRSDPQLWAEGALLASISCWSWWLMIHCSGTAFAPDLTGEARPVRLRARSALAPGTLSGRPSPPLGLVNSAPHTAGPHSAARPSGSFYILSPLQLRGERPEFPLTDRD